MCEKHYMRMRRNGTLEIGAYVGGSGPDNPGWRGENITYRAAHGRALKHFGPARNRVCIDCGRQAHHWSYNHGDPNEKRNEKGYRYSVNPEYYEPRCGSCHIAFDRQS